MKLLHRCTNLWRTAEVRDGEPLIKVVHGGFYLPYSSDRPWGIFENDGSHVLAAIDFREGIHRPLGQEAAPLIVGSDIADRVPDGTYIYGGRINPHFGHFLVNTLPRFWAMARIRTPNTKILCHGPGTPENWFNVPFIAATFELLGLTPRDFITFQNPQRLRDIVIPCASMEEQRSGYQVFGQMCREIGNRAILTNTVTEDTRPIYYSKSRLKSAVGVITNEAEIENAMRRAGIEIIYPETLSLYDQIRLMASRGRILGTAGSFLHASIFCPPRRIICLNTSETINSNYRIIDELAQNDANYYYPPGLKVLEKIDGFLTARYLPDAPEVAMELISML
jgi:capsular polysaccharide biosynthesis protein